MAQWKVTRVASYGGDDLYAVVNQCPIHGDEPVDQIASSEVRSFLDAGVNSAEVDRMIFGDKAADEKLAMVAEVEAQFKAAGWTELLN